jgi:hypothetical protein
VAGGRGRAGDPGGEELVRKTGGEYVMYKGNGFWAGEIYEEGGADFDAAA